MMFVVCYKNLPMYKGVDVFIRNSMEIGGVVEGTELLSEAKIFKTKNEADKFRYAYPFFDKYHGEGKVLTCSEKIVIIS